jgi:hypothetical protein
VSTKVWAIQTAILLVTYKPVSDGKISAVIGEFLKKDIGAQISHDVGDEFPPASYYPDSNKDRGTGALVFLTGTPAYMRMSLSISENRIAGLGGMPIEAPREKCRAPSTDS